MPIADSAVTMAAISAVAGPLYLFLLGSAVVAWLHLVRQPRSPNG